MELQLGDSEMNNKAMVRHITSFKKHIFCFYTLIFEWINFLSPLDSATAELAVSLCFLKLS